MLRRAWKPLAGTGLVAATVPAYYYFVKKPAQSDHPITGETFDLPVRVIGAEGKREKIMKTFPLFAKKHVDSMLREGETKDSHNAWNWTVSRLASNSPIEDAHSSHVVTRDPSDPSAPGDFLFFSVFDGHAGYHTSELLSKVLVNAVMLNLAPLTKLPTGWKSYLPGSSTPSDSDPSTVSTTIRTAFKDLDKALVDGPLQLLAASKAKGVAAGLKDIPMARKLIIPALSGSCALTTLIDTAHSNLYVACTGDCRAVAGYWQEDGNGKGSWRVEVLTQDQTGRNPSEQKRMQAEHPGEEGTVIRNGRVLGGLEPTRAFGDARYKWSAKEQKELKDAFFKEGEVTMREPPALLRTPPYVTAEPVVTHRNFSTEKSGKESLHFLVLATDGLWDRLTSEEVVSLVAGHLSGLKGSISGSQLNSLVSTSQGTPTVEGKTHARAVADRNWSFEDDNLSTHLIRNAMGGADEPTLRRLLSIPAGHSRSYRDDVTVQCVWWDPSNKTDNEIKAKL